MKNKEPIKSLLKLKDLELHTDGGRTNYRWGIVLVLLIIALTAGDGILIAFAYIISLIKTCYLKENILELPEIADIRVLLLLLISFFVICISILYFPEKAKEKLDKKIEEAKERSKTQ